MQITDYHFHVNNTGTVAQENRQMNDSHSNRRKSMQNPWSKLVVGNTSIPTNFCKLISSFESFPYPATTDSKLVLSQRNNFFHSENVLLPFVYPPELHCISWDWVSQ